MPPPGIPEWIFPGAMLRHQRTRDVFVIGTVNLHPNLRHLEIILQRVNTTSEGISLGEEMRSFFLGDLLAEWEHTSEYLYPGSSRRDFAERVRPENQAVTHEYFRWESPAPHARVMLLFIERIERGEVVGTIATSALEERITLEDFNNARLAGTCVHLGYEGVFSDYSRDGWEPDEVFIPGMIMLDNDNREVFLIARNVDATWIVRAAHDLQRCPPNYLTTLRFFVNQPIHDFAAYFHADDDGNMIPNGYDPADDGEFSAPDDDFTLADYNAILVRDVVDDEDYQLFMREDTSPPYASPRENVMGAHDPRMTLRAGDRWHFDAPNEGIWTIEAITPTRGDDPPYAYHFRSDEGRVMRTPGAWIIRNGRRISPPDPRFTGEPVAARQVWEIPTNVTRQRASRWRVTRVAMQANIRMVSLEPEGGGATIYWPEIRLRSQGRYVNDGVVRRTSFERLVSDDDDSV